MIGKALRIVVAVGIACYLILPLLIIVPIAFGAADTIVFPPVSFSGRWFVNLFADPMWRRAIGTSTLVALIVTVLSTTLGLLAAIGLRKMRAKLAWNAILGSPLVVPYVAYALGLYLLMSQLGLRGSLGALVLGHTVLALPYSLIYISAALSSLDDSQVRASRSLGANGLRVFRDVVLPHIAPAVVSSALFSFLVSFDEIIVAIFVSSSKVRTLPVVMWERVQNDLDPTIAAASVFLIAMTLLGLALLSIAQRKGREK